MNYKLSKSILERIGLENDSIRNPAHDRLILKWNAPSKILNLFLEEYHSEMAISWGEMDPQTGDVVKRSSEVPDSLIPKKASGDCLNWQRIIQVNKNYIIGYIDLHAIFPLPKIANIGRNKQYERRLTWYLQGQRISQIEMIVELRPSIDNFGTLLRQIATYRRYFPQAKSFVITSQQADFKWKYLFKKQGIILHSDLPNRKLEDYILAKS